MNGSANIGIGLYTALEAARMLHVPVLSVRRWLGGYNYKVENVKHFVPPLWETQLPIEDNNIELGFRDLIELKFISEFVKAGLALKTIRGCLDYARECVSDKHPFSTRRFQTDGRTIFLESASNSGEAQLLDLRKHQYAIKVVIEQTFKDLDIDNNAVARWRPYRGKESIVVDPSRAFGQPISSKFGVPTIVLFQAVEAEGSESAAASVFEVPLSVVRDAVAYEKSLAA